MSEYEDLQKEVEELVNELAETVPPYLLQQMITGVDLGMTQNQLFDGKYKDIDSFRTAVLTRVLAELNEIKRQLAEPKLAVPSTQMPTQIPGQQKLELVK